MYRRFICLSFSVCVALSLTGCNDAVFNDDSVIGPDLGRYGPFEAAHEIVMTEDFTDHESGEKGVNRTRRIDIRRGPSEDTGTLENVFPHTQKPFFAGVTYEPFVPIVAETNDRAYAYWLVAFNATRTPDRSTYMLLRYPKDLTVAPGLVSDAFEYTTLECDNLRVARRPADYYAPRKEGESEPPEPAPDPAPEAGSCEFNSHAEASRMTPLVLKRYDQIKHYEDAPKLGWETLHVEVR